MKLKKRKIVISSLLKPVNDVRMYEKFALNIKAYLNYDVEIIGSEGDNPLDTHGINFNSLFKQQRYGLERFIFSLKYYKKLLKLKPDINIVNTHDLQLVNVFYKIIFGTKLLYDVREDYYSNSLYMGGFKVNKWIIAFWVRSKESWCAYWMDGFLLAEKTYTNLSFTKDKSIIVENKLMPLRSNKNIIKDKFLIIYTGTISFEYGILEAIDMAIRYYNEDKRYHLIIIGYCANHNELKIIKERINRLSFITLVGGCNTVPHAQIIYLICKSSTSLLSYHINKALYNCFPTKFYECIYYSSKIKIKENKIWEDKIFSIFNNTNTKSLIFLANKFKLLNIIKNAS